MDVMDLSYCILQNINFHLLQQESFALKIQYKDGQTLSISELKSTFLFSTISIERIHKVLLFYQLSIELLNFLGIVIEILKCISTPYSNLAFTLYLWLLQNAQVFFMNLKLFGLKILNSTSSQFKCQIKYTMYQKFLQIISHWTFNGP